MICALMLATISLADFAEHTAGHYQVFAQSGPQIAKEANVYMNGMLRLYSKHFANWTQKDGARVVIFSNTDDFREYSRVSVGATHRGLLGYCHWKTDEDGNTFYELVAYEHAGLWQVLAHEGFHQFIAYELGQGIPIWLNEGMAQYFENAAIKDGRLAAGAPDQRRLAVAAALISGRRAPSLRELMAMDRATFYAGAEANYPVSYAAVYFLTTRRGAAFQRYLRDLKWARNTRRFERESAQWQTEFEHFVVNAGKIR